MKKNCKQCYALRLIDIYYCALGFKIDPLNAIPQEECPKPTTIAKFAELKIEQSRKKKEEEYAI